ncbi:MAG: HAD-IA family hydrolase, partial [Streptococcus sp.]|nr:HAD-IA family hydrolase [Streptococcus sp.]
PVLFEGARAVLAKIVTEGGRNFLVSHRNHLVLDILDKAEIASYFTEVVTSENGFARKPSPDSFLYLINKYDIKHGLVIGDRQIDIEAGKATGLDTLLVDGHKSLLEIVT